LSNPTATKSKRTKNRKVVTATKLKNIFEATESYFILLQPRRQNISSNKTCNNQNRVSNRKATMNLLSRNFELKSYNILSKPACALRAGIADGWELVFLPPEPQPGFLLKINIKN